MKFASKNTSSTYDQNCIISKSGYFVYSYLEWKIYIRPLSTKGKIRGEDSDLCGCSSFYCCCIDSDFKFDYYSSDTSVVIEVHAAIYTS